MKTLILLIVAAVGLAAVAPANAMLTSAQKTTYGGHTPIEGIEKVINQKRGVMKCVYDFSALGGAVGTLSLKDENGDYCALPSKAIVTQVYTDVVTTPASATSTGTISLGLNTTTDLKGATAVSGGGSTLWVGTQAATPVGTAATMVKATAARIVSASIAVEALTAGKINAFIEFVFSD